MALPGHSSGDARSTQNAGARYLLREGISSQASLPEFTAMTNISISGSATLMLAFAIPVLGGCSAEVAGGAATAGALQATQAKQAKAQQEQIMGKLKEAQEAAAARAAAGASGSD